MSDTSVKERKKWPKLTVEQEKRIALREASGVPRDKICEEENCSKSAISRAKYRHALYVASFLADEVAALSPKPPSGGPVALIDETVPFLPVDKEAILDKVVYTQSPAPSGIESTEILFLRELADSLREECAQLRRFCGEQAGIIQRLMQAVMPQQKPLA